MKRILGILNGKRADSFSGILFLLKIKQNKRIKRVRRQSDRKRDNGIEIEVFLIFYTQSQHYNTLNCTLIEYQLN